MNKTKLLVLEERSVFENNVSSDLLDQCDITLLSPFSVPEAVIQASPDAEVLLVNPTISVPREVICGLPSLKMIQTEGVGFEGVDLQSAQQRGVFVCNCRSVNAASVAEHTVMLMLCCLRDVINGHSDVLSGRQNDRKVSYMQSGSLRELGDCTVGFIGFGAIGREAARITSAFGAKILYYKPNRLAPEKELYAEYRSLDALLSESDIVSLNLPLNAQTENMANAAFFARMKRGSYLINTARGSLVNSADLIDALKTGQLSGAGLDCLDNEPVQTDHILLTAPEEVRKKIIFTPHIGGVSKSSFVRTYKVIAENIRHISLSERPCNIVNGL